MCVCEAYTLLRMLDVPYTRDGKDQVLRMIHVRILDGSGAVLLCNPAIAFN